MADIMFRKQDYEQAVFHLQQLLERKPGKYPLIVLANALNSFSPLGSYVVSALVLDSVLFLSSFLKCRLR